MVKRLPTTLLLLLLAAVSAQADSGGTSPSSVCRQLTAGNNYFLTSAGPTTAAAIPQLTGDCAGPINSTQANALHLNATNVTGVSTYQMLSSDVIVAVDATAQNVTVTLPQNLGGQVTPDSFIIKTDSSTHTVSVAPFSGDTVNGSSSSIVIGGQGNAVKTFPVNPQQWFAQEQSTASVQVVVAASGATNWAAAANTFMLMGGGVASGTETSIPVQWSRAGLWSNLSCNVATSALTTTQTFTVSIKSCTPSSGTCATADNGSFSCQIASGHDGGLLCKDTTHTAITAANDFIDLLVTPANTPTAQTGRCSIQFFPF